MGSVKRFLRPVARNSAVRRARRLFGRVGAPGLNQELESVSAEIVDLRRRLDELSNTNPRLDVIEPIVGWLQAATAELQAATGSLQSADLVSRVNDIERHMPAVLNAVASTNGTARLLRRELDSHVGRLSSDVNRVDEVLGRLSGDINRLDGHVRDELWPLMARAEGLDGLYETSAWLTERIEMVRAELMHELRYGASTAPAGRSAAIEIVNKDAVREGGPIRLNLGCGHIPIEGYVNVDMRKLPGVDVVAPLDAMPFEPGTIDEVFSAHVLEHFPQAALERQLLPYWQSLLAAGGTFRAIVPDLEAMIDQYKDGLISFENLRLVAYGGQEYEGDFHHTGFTPTSLTALLEKAGFVGAELIERGRVNGDCLEFEVVARRPG